MSSKIDGISAADSKKPGASELQEWDEPLTEPLENEVDLSDPQMGKQLEKVLKESVRPIKSIGATQMAEPLKPTSEKRELKPGNATKPKLDPQQEEKAKLPQNSSPPKA
jgi:hypothetical protein